MARLAALATEQAVDAVLVAGDVFDGNLVADRTLLQAMAAMRGFAGPWLLLPGNHDAALAESAWTRLERLDPPANLLIARTPAPIVLADGRLVVLPAPLTERHSQDDLTAWMDTAATPAMALRVGLAHGSVADRLPAAAEAANPIAPDRAETARLDYLALGDWHGTLEIAPRTWYAGTPEPDRFKANAAGQALLVELDGPGAPPRVTPLATAAHAETRCGWLSNPSMGLWELYDADGLWTIRSNAIHYEAKGTDKIPDISTGEYVHTFASHGYACACMEVVTEPEIVLEIRSVRQLPLATCERDPAIRYFLDKNG